MIRDFSLKCESVPSREKLLISKSLSPNVVVKKFDKKVVESAKDDINAVGAIEGTVNKNITVFNRLASKEGCNSGQKLPTQRHLFGIKSSSKILTNGRSPSRGIKESKMSVSLKTKIRPKLAKMRSETPEKSEIIRMFEKIVKNRDITDNVNVEITDSKVETGTDLLPDIRSGNATFSRENSTIMIFLVGTDQKIPIIRRILIPELADKPWIRI